MKKILLLTTSIAVSASTLSAVGTTIDSHLARRINNNRAPVNEQLFGSDSFLLDTSGSGGLVREWVTGANVSFVSVLSFKVTTDFASDLNAGDQVRFNWSQTEGYTSNSAQVYLLNIVDTSANGNAPVAAAADNSVLLLDNHTGADGAYNISFDVNTITSSPETWTSSHAIWIGFQIPFDGDVEAAEGLEVDRFATLTLTTIPEPGAYVLLGGLCALSSVLMRRRRD